MANQHIGIAKSFVLAAICSFPAISVSHAASVISVVNAVRTSGCGAGKVQALSFNAKLNQAAAQLANGLSAHDAAKANGYQPTQLSSIHLTGYENEAALTEVLRSNYCSTLTDRNLEHIGIARRANELWILLGAQLDVPQDTEDASRRVLELVNEARAHSRNCGSQHFAATSPLRLNIQLEAAAQVHSQEMAKYSYLEHKGHDGTTPAQRVTRQGYAWGLTGENIAGGVGTPDAVVAGWLKSAGHCANIMTPAFTEMGVSYALSDDDYGIYWTQVFATPQVKAPANAVHEH